MIINCNKITPFVFQGKLQMNLKSIGQLSGDVNSLEASMIIS